MRRLGPARAEGSGAGLAAGGEEPAAPRRFRGGPAESSERRLSAGQRSEPRGSGAGRAGRGAAAAAGRAGPGRAALGPGSERRGAGEGAGGRGSDIRRRRGGDPVPPSPAGGGGKELSPWDFVSRLPARLWPRLCKGGGGRWRWLAGSEPHGEAAGGAGLCGPLGSCAAPSGRAGGRGGRSSGPL